MAEKLPLWGVPIRTTVPPQALPPRFCLVLMFLKISWTACFMKSLLSLTHSMTSLLSLSPAALGVLQSLPSPLCIPSASHHSSWNRMVLMCYVLAEDFSVGFGTGVSWGRRRWGRRESEGKEEHVSIAFWIIPSLQVNLAYNSANLPHTPRQLAKPSPKPNSLWHKRPKPH